jgi:hypothetical protein
MLKINPYIVNNQVTMCKFLDEISVCFEGVRERGDARGMRYRRGVEN